MNTAEVIEKCRELPGVTVKTEKNYIDLILSDAGGTGRMRFFPVFPGVTLARIFVAAPTWPPPSPDGGDGKGPLIVNYCIRGRCELVLNDNRHVFLISGQISLTERYAQSEYMYPGREYEGIELFIDPDTAAGEDSMLKSGFGLDVTELRDKYCPDGETFIAGMHLPDALREKLWEQGCGGAVQEVGMKTSVIELLAALIYETAEMKTARPVYYTKSQVGIAKRTEEIITADLSKQHTVREFAELFSVSESSVKNYFCGVFGQSISRYVTHKRMLYAAELLSGTRLSVIEVANRAGYVNQSKFAAAFRREFSCSPLEYRRKTAVPGGLKTEY